MWPIAAQQIVLAQDPAPSSVTGEPRQKSTMGVPASHAPGRPQAEKPRFTACVKIEE